MLSPLSACPPSDNAPLPMPAHAPAPEDMPIVSATLAHLAALDRDIGRYTIEDGTIESPAALSPRLHPENIARLVETVKSVLFLLNQRTSDQATAILEEALRVRALARAARPGDGPEGMVWSHDPVAQFQQVAVYAHRSTGRVARNLEAWRDRAQELLGSWTPPEVAPTAPPRRAFRR